MHYQLGISNRVFVWSFTGRPGPENGPRMVLAENETHAIRLIAEYLRLEAHGENFATTSMSVRWDVENGNISLEQVQDAQVLDTEPTGERINRVVLETQNDAYDPEVWLVQVWWKGGAPSDVENAIVFIEDITRGALRVDDVEDKENGAYLVRCTDELLKEDLMNGKDRTWDDGEVRVEIRFSGTGSLYDLEGPR